MAIDPELAFDTEKCPVDPVTRIPPCENLLIDPTVAPPPPDIPGCDSPIVTPLAPEPPCPGISPQTSSERPFAGGAGMLTYQFNKTNCCDYDLDIEIDLDVGTLVDDPAFDALCPAIDGADKTFGFAPGSEGAAAFIFTNKSESCGLEFDFELLAPCPPIRPTTLVTKSVAQSGGPTGELTYQFTKAECEYELDIAVTAPSAGAQGFQGFQGFQGPAGGAQGSQGAQGFQGFQGSQGNQGFQGFQGHQGDTGGTGATGAQGAQGNQGFQGFQGAQGHQGFQGAQGFQGFQGFQGAQGHQGFRGFQGFQGSQGAQGEEADPAQPGWGPIAEFVTNICVDENGMVIKFETEKWRLPAGSRKLSTQCYAPALEDECCPVVVTDCDVKWDNPCCTEIPTCLCAVFIIDDKVCQCRLVTEDGVTWDGNVSIGGVLRYVSLSCQSVQPCSWVLAIDGATYRPACGSADEGCDPFYFLFENVQIPLDPELCPDDSELNRIATVSVSLGDCDDISCILCGSDSISYGGGGDYWCAVVGGVQQCVHVIGGGVPAFAVSGPYQTVEECAANCSGSSSGGGGGAPPPP